MTTHSIILTMQLQTLTLQHDIASILFCNSGQSGQHKHRAWLEHLPAQRTIPYSPASCNILL